MSTYEDGKAEEDGVFVRPEVIEGIEDIAEGRTMSTDDLDDVLKF